MTLEIIYRVYQVIYLVPVDTQRRLNVDTTSYNIVERRRVSPLYIKLDVLHFFYTLSLSHSLSLKRNDTQTVSFYRVRRTKSQMAKNHIYKQ